jgi:hypothetical protein
VSIVQNAATIFEGLWHDVGNLTGMKACFERGADMPHLRCKKLSGSKVVLMYQWPVNLGAAPARYHFE